MSLKRKKYLIQLNYVRLISTNSKNITILSKYEKIKFCINALYNGQNTGFVSALNNPFSLTRDLSCKDSV